MARDKHRRELQEDFENDLMQEEAAMDQQVQPIDESQLMIRNLEENSKHLEKAADESQAKFKNSQLRSSHQAPPNTVPTKAPQKQEKHKPLTKPSQ